MLIAPPCRSLAWSAASLVIALMALSFFGKGVGALGWAIRRYPFIVGPIQRFVLAEPDKYPASTDCSAIPPATHA